MQIRWSRAAADDLRQIAGHLKAGNSGPPPRLVQSIYDAVAALARQPDQGRRGRVEGTRELVLSAFPSMVIYRVLKSADAIEIVNVIHGETGPIAGEVARTPTQQSPRSSAWPPRLHLVVPALLLMALALCYAPALSSTFGFADDFPHLMEAHNQVKWVQEFWSKAGRPIGGFLTEWGFRAVGTIAELACLRATALLLLLVLAALIYRHLLIWLREPPLAALATAFVCTQPPFVLHVGWASLWLYLINPLLSYAAYHAITRGEQGDYRRRAKWLLTALLLLYIALNIYQPSAMFLWFWFGVEAVLGDTKPRYLLRRFILFLAVCAAAATLYYGIFRLLGYHSSRAQFVLDVPRKLEWFLRTVMTTASRLQWFENVSRWLPLTVWLVIVPGLVLLRRNRTPDVLMKMAVSAASVFLCYLPLLAVSEYDVPFRSQLALTAYIGALFFVAVYRIMVRLKAAARLRYTVLCALVAVGLVKSNAILVSHIVLPQSLDYSYLRSALLDAIVAHKKAVIVGCALPPNWHWDELRLITSVMPVEYRMLDAMGFLIVNEIWRLRTPPPDDIVTVLPHGAPLSPPNDRVIIDMQPVMDMLSSE